MKKIFRIFTLLYLFIFTLLGLLFIFGVLDPDLMANWSGKLGAALALILLVCSIGFLLTPQELANNPKDDPPSHLR